MSIEIRYTSEVNTAAQEAGEFLAQRILEKLQNGSQVLLFVTGGSSVLVGIIASNIISGFPHENLTIALTDERYGPLEHKDSNWHQLILGGFSFTYDTVIPVLSGNDRETTVKNYNSKLQTEFLLPSYKIGLFGVGADGHTAGILPHSMAVNSEEYVVGYASQTFERITITPKTISLLDEAVVFMQGKEKWPVVEDIQNRNTALTDQPVQILKKIPVVTIFTDYQN